MSATPIENPVLLWVPLAKMANEPCRVGAVDFKEASIVLLLFSFVISCGFCKAIPTQDSLTRDTRFSTDLCIACYLGDLEKVRLALDRIPPDQNINERFGVSGRNFQGVKGEELYDPQSWTPLMALCAGCERRSAEDNARAVILGMLIEKGATVNVKNSDGFSALHFACSSGCPEVTRLLLLAGADANCRTTAALDGFTRETPLHCAVRSLNPERLVELLLLAGGNPMAKDSGGRTPSDVARNLGRYALLQAIGDIVQRKRTDKRFEKELLKTTRMTQ